MPINQPRNLSDPDRTERLSRTEPLPKTERLSRTERIPLDDKNKRPLLADFSASTVIASTLASVTSFLLSSKIGLAGSLIGVGIAAAATAVASQVYKGLLTASADRLRAKAHDYADDYSSSGTNTDETINRPVKAQPTHDQTTHAGLVGAVIVVTAAIVAVLGYAAAVTFATDGQGIGPTEPLVITVPATTQEPAAASAPDDIKTLPADSGDKKDEAVSQDPTASPEPDDVAPSDDAAATEDPTATATATPDASGATESDTPAADGDSPASTSVSTSTNQ